MSEKKKDDTPGPESGNPGRDGGTAMPHEQELSVADDLADTKDRLLRCLAEQENIRRRARRDQNEAVLYASAAFAGDLLSSLDDLERAVASVPEGQRTAPVVAGLLGGIEATHRALVNAFAKHGLVRIDPLGEPFDPHRHEGSFVAVDARHPPRTVISVIRPGYAYRDRLLRPALVGISKGPHAPPEEPGTPGGTASRRSGGK